MTVCSVVLCVYCRSEFSAWIVFQVVLLYSEDDMVVMLVVDVRCFALWLGCLCRALYEWS